MRIFPDPLYYQDGQHNGLPAETINTKVSGKVNLIFYKLNLFPSFLVDKVKKNRKIVICSQRIMKNSVTITAAGVTQCEFSIKICKFKSNPSILNRIVPQVLFHNLTK